MHLQPYSTVLVPGLWNMVSSIGPDGDELIVMIFLNYSLTYFFSDRHHVLIFTEILLNQVLYRTSFHSLSFIINRIFYNIDKPQPKPEPKPSQVKPKLSMRLSI